VAAALGICRERQAYEGEAAMRLEALIDSDAMTLEEPGYLFELGPATIYARPIWALLLRDVESGVPASVIAARFHKGLAQAVAEMAERLARARSVATVALSGGCFQNAILFTEIAARLEARGLNVLSHSAVPCTDGGLALGQAAIAAARLIEGASRCA
jgi:hydrogenase maturation protein HypF